MTTFKNYTDRYNTTENSIEIVRVGKAYTSIAFRGNTLNTTTSLNNWVPIKTNVAYTLGSVDSGNCSVIDNGDSTYNFKYADSTNSLTRVFLMVTTMTADFSSGGTSKTVNVRIVLKRAGVDYPNAAFANIVSSNSNETIACSAVLQLEANDELFFEVQNTVDSTDILFKSSSNSAIEV